MEEDVGLEALFVPIAKGLFDQTLDLIVEALNGTIGLVCGLHPRRTNQNGFSPLYIPFTLGAAGASS
jgi:hypothetical protein